MNLARRMVITRDINVKSERNGIKYHLYGCQMLFFLRRNNLYPKFVLNCCDAVSTDTMHRIKFNNDIEPERIVLSYYNSISFAFTEICGRSYGGGVLEILPGEVGNVLVPILDCVPIEKVKEILYQVYEIVRNGENIEEALDLVDNSILGEYLHVNEKTCSMAREYGRRCSIGD